MLENKKILNAFAKGDSSEHIEKFLAPILETIIAELPKIMESGEEPQCTSEQPYGLPNAEEDESDAKKNLVVKMFFDGDFICGFETLDTIEYKGDKYDVETPYYENEEEYDLNSPADVYIMKEAFDDDGGPRHEAVEDENLLQEIYGIFKRSHSEEFEFIM